MDYTKGEWKVEDKTQVVSGNRLVANTGGYTTNYCETLTENMANAHLIAAAPTMYEALKQYIRETTNALEAYGNAQVPDIDWKAIINRFDKKAREAVRKAEGKTL